MPFDESLKDKLSSKSFEESELLSQNQANPPIDGKVEVSCDPDGNLANVVLYPAQYGGRPITVEKVLKELNNKGVVEGIDEYDIKYIVEDEVYETVVCVARAIPPVRGKNGYIEYHFDKQHTLKPQQDEFGVANYHELNSIVPIHKGDIIADITLPTEGEPGVNVFGKPIPASPGIPASFTLGKNTVLTADGKAIVSAVDGHIVYGYGMFMVEDTVLISADLDLSVGNIDFFGDVHVRGDVMEGFKITAGKNIRVDGIVFGGKLIAGGNIRIGGGCLNAEVECEGNFTAGFCENSRIMCKGSVESKQFAFCNIFCYGTLTAKGTDGAIVGGKVTSMKNVTASCFGSKKYTNTEINIGDGSVLFARKREAEAQLSEESEQYNLACKNLEFLKQRKAEQNGVFSYEQQRQFQTETQNKLIHSVRKKELSELITQLENDILNKDDLVAKCTKIIYPGTHFCINFLTLEITVPVERSTVTIADDRLVVVPN